MSHHEPCPQIGEPGECQMPASPSSRHETHMDMAVPMESAHSRARLLLASEIAGSIGERELRGAFLQNPATKTMTRTAAQSMDRAAALPFPRKSGR